MVPHRSLVLSERVNVGLDAAPGLWQVLVSQMDDPHGLSMTPDLAEEKGETGDVANHGDDAFRPTHIRWDQNSAPSRRVIFTTATRDV